MKIQVASDLHLDGYVNNQELTHTTWREFIEAHDPSEVDILVLAGDICPYEYGLANMLRAFCAIYERVIFVPGNHDYYFQLPLEYHELLEELEIEIPNLHWLRNKVMQIGELKIAGTTLWYGRPTDGPTAAVAHNFLDYRCIQNHQPWVYGENAAGIKFLQDIEEVDVVITHHLPLFECSSPGWRTSSLQHFFVCDIRKIVKKLSPKLWIFGHTHNSRDFMFEDTRMLCNPRGYPQRMNREYIDKLIVEI